MGWVSLTLRKQSLQLAISDAEFRDIELSRKLRKCHRNLAYEQSVYNADKTRELNDARATYTAMRNSRPSVKSEGYAEWQNAYSDAKEDYEQQRNDIEDYYDGILEELERDATDEEDAINQERTTLEAQLEAMRTELEAVGEQISQDIQNGKLKLGGN